MPRALLSVYDKTGLAAFAVGLVDLEETDEPVGHRAVETTRVHVLQGRDVRGEADDVTVEALLLEGMRRMDELGR